MVVDSSTCSAIASALGRISASIASACAMVGRTFVFTSSASASIFALVFFKTTNMATRTPACNRTAIPVNATNTGVRFSISLLQQFHSGSAQRKAGQQCLRILGRSRLRSGFMIGLPPRLVGGAELLFLLRYHVAALVRPLRRLFARLTRSSFYIFTTFVGTSTQYFSSLVARAR